jgi:Acyltransferase family
LDGRTGRFRADVEGLRAVAVLAVVLYHAGLGAARGGYAGVDVFYVLSGFLITGLLWDELRQTGRLAFRSFYARRARRLLPAAVLVVVVTVDGLITNGKFCCVRRMQLSLTWWHRPLRLRRSALHADAALVGEPHDPDLDRPPPAQPASRRRTPVGSGLPAAGALGRARRPAPAGADRRGGA